MIRFEEGKQHWYKVTLRVPSFSIAETKMFRSKSLAKRQFEKWLGE